MSKPAPAPPRRGGAWVPPPLVIRCPACTETLGRCHDAPTRTLALQTHGRTECPGSAPA